jgi:hypothetical protein
MAANYSIFFGFLRRRIVSLDKFIQFSNVLSALNFPYMSVEVDEHNHLAIVGLDRVK